MANLNVSYGEMESVAGRLTAGQAELEAKLQELNALMDQLVATGFVTGVASGRLQEAYARYNTSAKTTVASLSEVANYLRRAIAALQDTDTALGNAIN